MYYVPAHIKDDPDTYFNEAWPFYKISGRGNMDIGSDTMETFKRLVSSSTDEQLQEKRDFLLSDYGMLLHQIEVMDQERIDLLNSYGANPSLRAKIVMEHRLKCLRPSRRMKMTAFDHVNSLLMLICHHLTVVRAGDANPIKDEVEPELAQ